jgi:CspA family cold shock protein
MASGTVKWFNMQKGYGFIGPDDGDEDIFVHISAVLGAGLPELREGQAVEFEIELAKDGNTAATNLKLR